MCEKGLGISENLHFVAYPHTVMAIKNGFTHIERWGYLRFLMMGRCISHGGRDKNKVRVRQDGRADGQDESGQAAMDALGNGCPRAA